MPRVRRVRRGARGAALVVVANTAQAAHEASQPGTPYSGTHPIGERVPLQSRDGASYVAVRDVGPSEVLLLINRG